MPSLSTQSSKTSVSWPGHPMAAGSYMLQAAQEPILVTHTNFQAAAPPSRSCSANSDRARSPTSDRAQTPTTTTNKTIRYRCIFTAAVLMSILALALLIAGLVFLLDGDESTSRVLGIIFVILATLMTLCALVVWRYTCQRRKMIKESQQAVSLKSIKSTNSSSYVPREIYL